MIGENLVPHGYSIKFSNSNGRVPYITDYIHQEIRIANFLSNCLGITCFINKWKNESAEVWSYMSNGVNRYLGQCEIVPLI